jgi:hypothetical protein
MEALDVMLKQEKHQAVFKLNSKALAFGLGENSIVSTSERESRSLSC